MKLVIILLGLAYSVTAGGKRDWNEFKIRHNKNYETTNEELKRREIFEENLEKIQRHNSLYDSGEKSYRLGVNKYADLTNEEFQSVYGAEGSSRQRTKLIVKRNKEVRIPDEWDWRNQGIVSDVKDQGQCASSWAFSATGSLEGQVALATGNLVSFSEQQLLDCSADYGNQGCSGGLVKTAFEYIRDRGGIVPESFYPYTGMPNTCQFDHSKVSGYVAGFVDLQAGDEGALGEALTNVGPLSVALDGSQWSFQLYEGGIYNEPDCSTTSLNQAALLVGYGRSDGADYWIVKNSWGESWGEGGYMRIARNASNACGIATLASYPLLINPPYPNPV